jgi:hypothetical protein
MNIYCLYDSKTSAYMQPFFKPDHATAKREFSFAVNDYRSVVAKCPEDFTLFHIGQYNEETGVIDGIPGESLGNAIEYIDEELAKKINFQEGLVQ